MRAFKAILESEDNSEPLSGVRAWLMRRCLTIFSEARASGYAKNVNLSTRRHFLNWWDCNLFPEFQGRIEEMRIRPRPCDKVRDWTWIIFHGSELSINLRRRCFYMCTLPEIRVALKDKNWRVFATRLFPHCTMAKNWESPAEIARDSSTFDPPSSCRGLFERHVNRNFRSLRTCPIGGCCLECH